jgi:hypothetical protein
MVKKCEICGSTKGVRLYLLSSGTQKILCKSCYNTKFKPISRGNKGLISAGTVVIVFSMILIFLMLGTMFLFALFILGCVLLLGGLYPAQSNTIKCPKCGNPLIMSNGNVPVCPICDTNLIEDNDNRGL